MRKKQGKSKSGRPKDKKVRPSPEEDKEILNTIVKVKDKK